MPRPLAIVAVTAVLLLAACSAPVGATPSATEMMEESPSPRATKMMEHSASPGDSMMEESPSPTTP